MEILDIDDTFCAAHGGQQLAFWNAREDERGFGASCPAEPPTMADQSQTRCMASRLAPIQLLGSRGRAFAAEVQKCAAWCMIRVRRLGITGAAFARRHGSSGKQSDVDAITAQHKDCKLSAT
jgi:hypothetical protein